MCAFIIVFTRVVSTWWKGVCSNMCLWLACYVAGWVVIHDCAYTCSNLYLYMCVYSHARYCEFQLFMMCKSLWALC